MSTIQVEAQMSPDELLKAVRQLSSPELDVFVSQAITLRAQRKAPSLSEAEVDLLATINRGLPPERQKRYADLIARRRDEALTPDELTELLHVSDQLEELETKRVEALAELARLRQTSLTELMGRLGIQTPAYA